MTRYVLLRMSDEDARTFLEDVREYPDSPVLTPTQEHEVDVDVVSDDLERDLEHVGRDRLRAPATVHSQSIANRREGEANMLAMVLRLVRTGDWMDPEERTRRTIAERHTPPRASVEDDACGCNGVPHHAPEGCKPPWWRRV